MIRRMYKLWPSPTLLMQLWSLSSIRAVVQGLLLGLMVPLFRVLISPIPNFLAATPWLVAGVCGLVAYWVLSVVSAPVGLSKWPPMKLMAGP